MVSDFRNQLRSYLKLDSETRVESKDPQDEPRVVVRLTVKNTAGIGEPFVFEKVILRVGIPPAWQSHQFGALSPGDSASSEHRILLREFPDLRYELDWKVSWEAISSFQASGVPSSGPSGLSLGAYVRACQAESIHRWKDDLIDALAVPSATTTLGELEALGKRMEKAMAEVGVAQTRLQRLAELVDRQHHEALSGYTQTLGKYLSNTVRCLSELRQALLSGDARRVGSALADARHNLDRAAKEVEEASARLLATTR